MIVGVDFGAPRWARDQRRKIIAVAAQSPSPRVYRVGATGMNARLLVHDLPGWSAAELLRELLLRPARLVGFDFPFSVPHSLLQSEAFAASVGVDEGAFLSWHAFNAHVAQRLPLTDPLDFTPFAAWCAPSDRARLWARRATDVATAAQPPLKNKFQATFQMTLLGNALLARLSASRSYQVLPFHGAGGAGEIIEVYPGATLRTMGLAAYKSRPEEALHCCVAACTAAGITLDIDETLVDLACRYNSGTAKSPDYDVADAIVALCTTILYGEGRCRAAVTADPPRAGQTLTDLEGAIWLPTRTTTY